MALADKLIIVTGGAGFIGSAIIRVLNDRGLTNIVVVDNLGSSEKWKNLVGKKFCAIIHKSRLFSWLEGRSSEIQPLEKPAFETKGDDFPGGPDLPASAHRRCGEGLGPSTKECLLSEKEFDKRSIGAIIHMGACSSTMETDANYLLENNVHYTQKLIDYALKHKIRLIYASSAATYGDGSQGFSDDHDKLHSLRPLNMYGYSKHLVDLWAYDLGLLNQIVGLKYFNIFGPNEYHKGPMTSALYKMVPQIRASGAVKLFKSSEPTLYADGEQCRDFLYVKDAARMTADFLFNEAMGIYNIGMGQTNTWNYLATCLFKALKQPLHIEYSAMPPQLLGKYQNYTCAAMDKFHKNCPGFVMTSLEEAVFDYVREYLLEEKTW